MAWRLSTKDTRRAEMSSPRREDDGEDNRRHGSLAQEINAIIDNIENEEDINDGDIFDAVDADEAEEPADNNEEAEDDDDVLIVEAEPILSTTRDIAAIFRMWESTHSRHGFDPVPILTRYVVHRPNCAKNMFERVGT